MLIKTNKIELTIECETSTDAYELCRFLDEELDAPVENYEVVMVQTDLSATQLARLERHLA